DEPLDPPGEHRPAVREVVAGGTHRRGGHQAVAPHAPELLRADGVTERRHPAARPPLERDVVHADPPLAVQLHRQGRAAQYLVIPVEGVRQALLDVLAIDGREEADGPEVEAEDGGPFLSARAQRSEDRAVAAEDEREVDRGLGVDSEHPPRAGLEPVLLDLGLREPDLDAALGGDLHEPLHRVTGLLGLMVREDRDALGTAHASTRATSTSLSIPAAAPAFSAIQTNVSLLPAGPVSREGERPSTAQPSSAAPCATPRMASRRSSTPRPTPPLPSSRQRRPWGSMASASRPPASFAPPRET